MKLNIISFYFLNHILSIAFVLLFNWAYAQDANKLEYNSEMNKVLTHYAKSQKDSLKFKAAKFLVKNISIHGSQTYYWVDSIGNKVAFDELDYPDFRASANAIKRLSDIHGGSLRPKPTFLPDINSIEADFLIEAIDAAFEQYDTSIDFSLFCEYILPYRISIEPLSNWRKVYQERFSRVIDDSMALDKKITFLKDNLTNWFVCTYNIEIRPDPLPVLSALQLLHRKKGPCEDVANLSVFALRSLGIPSTVDVVPYWGTSTGGHTLNVAFDEKGAPIHFDVLSQSDSLYEFIREPAKVFRLTYSSRSNTLSARFPKANIPPYGMLRSTNYLDVTHEYWPTRDVIFKLFDNIKDSSIVYVCTFNGEKWRPVWWGLANNGYVIATNMGQGVVYLPKILKDGKLITAGYPVTNGYSGAVELEPFYSRKDTHITSVVHSTITLPELKRYIKYKPGEKYKLYFFDDKWRFIDGQVAEGAKELKFGFVPKNSLLFLKYKSSKGKGRPFTINDKGERIWW